MFEKIKELHRIGVKTAEEVKRHLNNYVVNTLFAGKETSSQARRRYFPTTNDIRNILNTQPSGDRKVTDDQENLCLKCDKWQQENPKDSTLFRVIKLDNHYPSFNF